METLENNNTQENNTNNENNSQVYNGCGCSNPNAFSQTMKEGIDKMFNNMKSCTIMLIAAISLIFCGCQTLPSTDSMDKMGGAAGFTTAYVLNRQVNITNTTTRTVIIEVVTKIDNYLPATNETCSAKWTPMIKTLTDKYVENGDLTQKQADRVVSDFSTITTMLDKYIDKRGIRQYQELVDAFIHSFASKFLEYFTVNPNVMAISAAENALYSAEVDSILSNELDR